ARGAASSKKAAEQDAANAWLRAHPSVAAAPRGTRGGKARRVEGEERFNILPRAHRDATRRMCARLNIDASAEDLCSEALTHVSAANALRPVAKGEVELRDSTRLGLLGSAVLHAMCMYLAAADYLAAEPEDRPPDVVVWHVANETLLGLADELHVGDSI